MVMPVSFQKAADLIRLAEMAARYAGVGLQEIEAEFAVNRRTAQRMTRVLEEVFQTCTTHLDEERRKRWKLGTADLRIVHARGIRESELAALDIAIAKAEREGAANEARDLGSLRDRMLSMMPGAHARRVEADAEAILEAHGFASRPGPRARGDEMTLRLLAEALKGPFQLLVQYLGGRGAGRRRVLEPYGVLLGTRRYLVAREAGKAGPVQHFRVDRIAQASLLPVSFRRDPDFDLARHAALAFGSFHDPREYGEVVWRFRPDASAVARDFLFHPDQEMTGEADGSLVVRFRASGHLEMAWHLYTWGDSVEVIAPERLRRMVDAHRRSDFPALP